MAPIPPCTILPSSSAESPHGVQVLQTWDHLQDKLRVRSWKAGSVWRREQGGCAFPAPWLAPLLALLEGVKLPRSGSVGGTGIGLAKASCPAGLLLQLLFCEGRKVQRNWFAMGKYRRFPVTRWQMVRERKIKLCRRGENRKQEREKERKGQSSGERLCGKGKWSQGASSCG